MDGHERRQAIVGQGLEGCAHANPPKREVLFVSKEHLDAVGVEPGAIRENLTVEGLLEDSTHIGDQLRIGTALLEVTQPRMPCFKLGVRMRMPSFPKWFLKSGRLGFYLRVLEEGEIGAGDTIEVAKRDEEQISIREPWQLSHGDAFDAERIRQILDREVLAGQN